MNAIKKIFKLIRLGVFCKWFTNVNKQPDSFRVLLFSDYSWYEFIGASFLWGKTKEGPEFWRNIMNK